MTTDQFREAMATRPFKPFVLRSADGRDFKVDHPENAWATPGGRVVFVATTPDAAAALDLLLVTWLEPAAATPGSSQKPQ